MTQQAEKPTRQRLLEGAKILGNLWRRGKRCQRSWDIRAEDVLMLPCDCAPRTDFCTARSLWIELALKGQREIEMGTDGVGAIPMTMTPEEWDAAGLTVSTESEKAGLLKIGPKGTLSAIHLRKLAQDPESALSIFALQEKFPKMKVEGIIEPKAEAV